MGNCKLCGNKAGIFKSLHDECNTIRDNGLVRIEKQALLAVTTGNIDEAQLRSSWDAIAQQSFITPQEIDDVIAETWHRAVNQSLSDGVLTAEEESRLLKFRDTFAIKGDGVAASMATIVKGREDRVLIDAAKAAISAKYDESLDRVNREIQRLGLSPEDRKQTLIGVWTAGVDMAMEDGILTQEEEDSLSRFKRYFNLSNGDVEAADSRLWKGAVIRDVINGEIPYRMNAAHPFNFQKNENLVWIIRGVRYYETKTKRERRGSSHGVSIKIAKGVYYRPSTFKSRVHEWDENVHVDTGTLGITPKHLYFSGPKKSFRVRYDKIVSFDPFSNGIGFTQDGVNAKPKKFALDDGWFVYNLVTNLSNL